MITNKVMKNINIMKNNAKDIINGYLIHVIKSVFNTKPNVNDLHFNMNVNECNECDKTHFIIYTTFRYSYIGSVDDVNCGKIKINIEVEREIKKFTKDELEYAIKKVNLKELIDLIYD